MAAAAVAAPAAPLLDTLSIHVPGSPGGGFDRSGQAIRQALLDSGLVRAVQIVHSPGAAGLVGLAQFQAQGRDDAPSVIVGGRSILGATALNRSRISLADVTPIARLNQICLVIAVGKDSPIRTAADLARAMRTDASLIKWVGGSPGSVDDQLLSALATTTGVDRQLVRFSGIPGGGGDIAAALSAAPTVVGISSYEEFAEPLAAGHIRAVARSCRTPQVGGDIPSLAEQGIDVDFADWKGVFAPPGIGAAERDALVDLFGRLSRSQAWSERLAANRWGNGYLAGDGFATFVAAQQASVRESFVPAADAAPATDRLGAVLQRPYQWAALLAGIAAVLLVAILLQRRAARAKELSLRSSLAQALDETDRVRQERDSALARSRGYIASEFSRWRLSDAETEVGWMILKGLSFKEIGKLRSTSERTVRQQAQSIYLKSDLPSRTDLAAYFLEDLRFDRESQG